MKKIALYICLIIIFAFGGAYSSEKMVSAAEGFFPAVSELTGGVERWLHTGIKKEKSGGYDILSTTYSHFFDKTETLMDVKRRKSYKSEVEVYVFGSFISAYDFYSELATSAPKKRTRFIKFGDMGIYSYSPKSSYINDADFYLLFIYKNFVVSIKADDGFALMDVAYSMQSRMKKYITDNSMTFLVKKLKIQAYKEGLKTDTRTLSFAGDNPSEVLVRGRVFDPEMKPVDNATVRIVQNGMNVLTDENGNYEFVIHLQGDKKYELSKNFYMELSKTGELNTLHSGMYNVKLQYKNGKSRTQIWRLDVFSDAVYGTAQLASNPEKTYPLKGSIKDGMFNIKLDCSSSSSAFECSQVFKGRFLSGILSGTWKGTGGGGNFESDPDAYVLKTSEIQLNEKTAVFSNIYISDNLPHRPGGSKTLTVKATEEGEGYISAEIDRSVFLPEAENIKSVSLVLTHLPHSDNGRLRLFTFNAAYNEAEGNVRPETPKPAALAYPADEPYDIEVDISDYINTDGKTSFLIGPLSGTGDRGEHFFKGTGRQYSPLAPSLKITRYVRADSAENLKPVQIQHIPGGFDMVSSRNSVRKDGKNDIMLNAEFNLKGRTIQKMEIISGGVPVRKWNTNALDIYPVIGFIKNGKVLNNKDGSVSIKLEKEPEKYTLFIHKGSLKEENLNLKYRVLAGGEWYSGEVVK